MGFDWAVSGTGAGQNSPVPGEPSAPALLFLDCQQAHVDCLVRICLILLLYWLTLSLGIYSWAVYQLLNSRYVFGSAL